MQRGYSARNISGYLATDTNNNYKFIQTDYIRYSIASDGTITIGSKAYTVADSYKPLCSGNGPDNSFHLVVTDRESPDVLVANNTYCTAQSDNEFVRLIGDINTLTSNVNDQMRLVFLGSKGNPIPGNVNYNSGPNNNGDGRLQPLARQVAQLGGFYETIVYLTPQDKFFL